MNVTILLAHPRTTSFNHAIAERVVDTLEAAGHLVSLRDLYAEGFDPVLTAAECLSTNDATESSRVEAALNASVDDAVLAHRREIASADGLVVVHPNWWGKPPAILSGWIDRVLVPGVAYRYDESVGQNQPALGLQSALIINTADTPHEEQAGIGDPLQSIWINSVLPYCGNPTAERIVFTPVADSDPTQRTQWLNEVEAVTTRLFS